MRVNGPKDSLTIHTNQPHVIVQLPHVLGNGSITGREKRLHCEWPNVLWHPKTDGLLDSTDSFWDVRCGRGWARPG